jgi:metal-sulfur cluster biosynthetic enzyme
MDKDFKNTIIEALREVYDPDIPINVYDLGLIYEIEEKEKGRVFILMTLTSPTCPSADYLKSVITEAVEAVVGEGNLDLELTFEPAWNPDRVSMDAKEELGLTETMGVDLAVRNTFSPESRDKLVTCFKCAQDDKKIPLLAVSYKGEKVFICNSCLLNF